MLQLRRTILRKMFDSPALLATPAVRIQTTRVIRAGPGQMSRLVAYETFGMWEILDVGSWAIR